MEEKIIELLKNEEFIRNLINYEIEFGDSFGEIIDKKFNVWPNDDICDLAYKEYCKILSQDRDLLVRYFKYADLEDYIIMEILENNPILWYDEEVVYIILGYNLIQSEMPEEVFKYYLDKNEKIFINAFPSLDFYDLANYLLDKIEYIKKFAKYKKIKNFRYLDLANISLEDFDELLSYSTDVIFQNDKFVSSYDKAMLAIKKYHIKEALIKYSDYCTLEDTKVEKKVDIKLIKAAVRCGYIFKPKDSKIICSYDIAEYFIKEYSIISAFDHYLNNLGESLNENDVAKLLLLTCKVANELDQNINYHEYILKHYNLVRIVVENHSSSIIDDFVDICNEQPHLVDKKIDLELFEIALQNGYDHLNYDFLTYDYVSLALDYGIKSSFRWLIDKGETVDDELIIKYGLADEDIPRFREIKEEIIDTINGRRELSDSLKSINSDPRILGLMARVSLEELNIAYDELYNYDYIKTYIMYNYDIVDIISKLEIFALRCEEGFVKGKQIDEELFLTALHRGYRIRDNSCELIKLNPIFIKHSILKGDTDSLNIYMDSDGVLTDKLVYLALDKGYLIDYQSHPYIITNRNYIKYSIELGNPDSLNLYYSSTGNIDDELIRLAISKGYEINEHSPKEILSNYEYIKLAMLYVSDNNLRAMKNNRIICNYAKYLSKHPNDNLRPIDNELYDIIIDCHDDDVIFHESSVVPSYEACEYLLKRGCLNALDTYKQYLVMEPDNKKIDLHLCFIHAFYKGETNLDDKELSDLEKEIYIAFSICLNTLDKENIFNVDNLDEYCTKDGFTDKLINKLKRTDYLMYKKILDSVNHYHFKSGQIPIGVFKQFIPYLRDYIGISIDRIKLIENKLGTNILNYLDNVPVMNFVKLPTEDINKILDLYECDNFSLKEFQDKIYDALKQEQFAHDYPIFKNIFDRFRNSIRLNDNKELERLKYLVNTLLPEISYDKIDYIITLAYSGDYDALHNLCDKFIRKAREIYRYENNDIIKDIYLPYVYDEYDFMRKSCIYLLHYIGYKDIVNYTEIKEEEFEILKSIILDENIPTDIKEKYGKHANKLYKALYLYIKNKKDLEGFRKSVNNYFPIKKNYYIPLSDRQSILEQLSKMNIDMLINFIHNNNLYNNINNILKYYKIVMLPENLNSFIRDNLDIDVDIDFSDISKFIMNYSSFLEAEIRKQNTNSENLINYNNVKINFINLLKYIISINSEKIEARRILTKEDYSLICKDPGYYSSYMNTDSRLNRAIELVNILYNNGVITIPAYDKNISINSKEINVVIGNRTNTCNLTHGERTDACMRIGGIGETLFEFCLDNPNGFHIRFLEPNTFKYISRVSGFRNGNTVFLNQLRYSSDKELYTNNDLVEYTKVIAQELIDLTCNDIVPIENVFISDGYSMKTSNFKKYNLNIDIKEGLPHFYSDISSSNACLLASSCKNGYVPINTDKTNIDEYKPVRDKVIGIEVGIDKLSQLINSKYFIKLLLNNEDYIYIDDLEDIIDGYVGTDFYVYLDSDYNIHYDYFDMDNYHDKDVSLEEMNKYKEILMNKYNMSEKRY